MEISCDWHVFRRAPPPISIGGLQRLNCCSHQCTNWRWRGSRCHWISVQKRVKIYSDFTVAKFNDGVHRRFNRIIGLDCSPNQRHLMVNSRTCQTGYPLPSQENWPMHMTEEYVLNVLITRNQISKFFGFF